MAARLAALLFLAILVLPARGVPGEGRLAVIVHRERRATVARDEVAQIYLRRKRFWEDGAPIVPLNLAAGTAIRTAFAASLLRLDEARLAEYWNRQYFYGVRPPATLASSAAMKRYVSSDPNAIGYVPASEVDDSVRVILLVD